MFVKGGGGGGGDIRIQCETGQFQAQWWKVTIPWFTHNPREETRDKTDERYSQQKDEEEDHLKEEEAYRQNFRWAWASWWFMSKFVFVLRPL